MHLADGQTEEAFTTRLAAADYARLLAALNERHGFAKLTAHEREIALTNIATGLAGLDKPHSSGWAEVFRDLSALVDKWPEAQSGDVSELVKTILAQPSPARSREERKRCISVASAAVLMTVTGTGQLTNDFAHGLHQLFRSSAPHWIELASLNFLNIDHLKSQEAPNQKVVQKLRSDLVKICATALPDPAVFFAIRHNDLSAASSTSPAGSTADLDEIAESDSANKVTSSSDVAPPSSRAGKKPITAAPNLNLFEAQCNSNLQADNSDGWRLPIHWNKLAAPELQQALAKINPHLLAKSSDLATLRLRAHATARYLCLFAGLSLRIVWSLPIKRKGTLHYNVRQGLLRRDVLVAAPRAKSGDRQQYAGRWMRTHVPTEVASAMRDLCSLHPQARTVGELLEAFELTWEQCQRLLNDQWPGSHPPEDARFAMSLRPCLLSLGIHPALVAQFTGDITTTPPSDHYYLKLKASSIYEVAATFANWAGLSPPQALSKPLHRIGSPRALTSDTFQSAIKELQRLVLKSCNSITSRSSVLQVIEFHNLYTCAVALQIIWGLGGRGDRIDDITFESMFSSDRYVLLSDRRVDKYSQHRVCPTTAILNATRLAYLEHLRAVTGLLERANQKTSKTTASCNKPETPAFQIYEAKGESWIARALERSDLVKLAQRVGISELNAPRHFWFTELVEQGVSQVAIEALLGHHTTNAEPFGYGSGVSIRAVCEYLVPVVEKVQKKIGFEALRGRGQQDPQKHRLPELAVDIRLSPLPQVLLARKVKAQDELLQEANHYTQDPPVGRQTLVAHSHLNRLRTAILESGLVAKHPAGALLFHLISGEMTLTAVEVRSLYDSAVGDGAWSIGHMVVVEAVAGKRPIHQRILGTSSIAALHLVRSGTEQQNFHHAVKDLHQLLHSLDQSWPADKDQMSLDLLMRLSAHWAAIEVAPAAMFICHHKAPFVPAADLARLHYGRACALDQDSIADFTERPARKPNESWAPEIRNILSEWGDRDIKHGEDRARSKGCTDALLARRATSGIDEFEVFLIDLLIADLSTQAPYRQITVQTAREYARGYIEFVTIARREGTFDVGPECFLEAFELMGGQPADVQNSTPARWQMLHICAFLQEQVWVPPAFLTGRALKKPCLPRLPVYTHPTEIEHTVALLANQFSDKGGTFDFAGTRLNLQRGRPFRISEVRYASVNDYDASAGLLHVTTTGHAHLKTEASRGSIDVPVKLQTDIAQLQARKRQLDSSPRASLFADGEDGDYRSFDQISDAVRQYIASLTGRPEFRQHDLRCAATTDLASDFLGVVNRLCEGLSVTPDAHSAETISKAHARYAWASRQARHASVLTTLRYYVCSGPAELRNQLDLAFAGDDSRPSGLYVAALQGISPQVLYARAERDRSKSATSDVTFFARCLSQTLNEARLQLPTPRLGSTYEQTATQLRSTSAPADTRTLVHAALLALTGTNPQAAADMLAVPVARVEDLVALATNRGQELGVELAWDDKRAPFVGVTQRDHRGCAEQIAGLARWIGTDPSEVEPDVVIPAIVNARSSLSLRSRDQYVILLPLLSELGRHGFAVTIHPGQHCLPSDAVGLAAPARTAGVWIAPNHSDERLFARVSFAPKRPSQTEAHVSTPIKFAPRAAGRSGRVVIAALVLALVIKHSKEK
jgi:hypothetical protein